jgi:hypothetical protein
MPYKLLYLPTGRFLSDSIWQHPVPDDVHETVEKAEYAIRCNLDARKSHHHEVKETTDCWVCYNEFCFPIIREHFMIVEIEDVQNTILTHV